MTKLTEEFVCSAIQDTSWDLGNDVLYKLCEDHPDHKRGDVILAKVWLIGRAYAAAIERRRVRGEDLGDAFYEDKVVSKFLNSGIDGWFEELQKDTKNTPELTLQVHKNFTNLLNEISGEKKRSLASKYLHFHFRNRFFIYDSRAEKSIKHLTHELKNKDLPPRNNNIDTVYTNFFGRCEYLVRDIQTLTKKKLTPRELDKVLLRCERKKMI